jgi:hypothetical protein
VQQFASKQGQVGFDAAQQHKFAYTNFKAFSKEYAPK